MPQAIERALATPNTTARFPCSIPEGVGPLSDAVTNSKAASRPFPGNTLCTTPCPRQPRHALCSQLPPTLPKVENRVALQQVNLAAVLRSFAENHPPLHSKHSRSFPPRVFFAFRLSSLAPSTPRNKPRASQQGPAGSCGGLPDIWQGRLRQESTSVLPARADAAEEGNGIWATVRDRSKGAWLSRRVSATATGSAAVGLRRRAVADLSFLSRVFCRSSEMSS